MTSEEGLFFFKIRSNCFLALLERQALSSPAQGLAIYFSMAPMSLSFFNRHVPRDPSPGHYPASGGVGWKNSFSLSLQHLRPGSLICQARQEGGFLRGMTSEPSLCSCRGGEFGSASWEIASEEGFFDAQPHGTGLPYELLLKQEDWKVQGLPLLQSEFKAAWTN